MGGNMRRNDVCWYDYRDNGFWNIYGRIWKVVDGVYYFINTKGETIRTNDPTRLIVVPNYKGMWEWRTDHKTDESYQIWHPMPSLRKIKQARWHRAFKRTGNYWRDDT